jgi:large subunit ribosomal protein L2
MLHYFFRNIKKKLIKGFSSKGGRNLNGRVCIRGRGEGNKNLYRYIDFYRRLNQFGKILYFVYDVNRTAKLVLVLYNNGLCCYNILQKNVRINSYIFSGSFIIDEKIKLTNGFSLPVSKMPLFSIISNIELVPFQGSKLVKAAGIGSILIGKDLNNAYLKLNSG